MFVCLLSGVMSSVSLRPNVAKIKQIQSLGGGRLELLRYTATHHKLHFYTVLSAAARPVPRYYSNTRVLVESLPRTPQDTNII